MGYHYFNKQLIDDLVVDVLKPEGLVYAPADDGGLKLSRSSTSCQGAASNPAGGFRTADVVRPAVQILVPAVGFYRHAWLWAHNPSGMLAHWNPEVACPENGPEGRGGRRLVRPPCCCLYLSAPS